MDLRRCGRFGTPYGPQAADCSRRDLRFARSDAERPVVRFNLHPRRRTATRSDGESAPVNETTALRPFRRKRDLSGYWDQGLLRAMHGGGRTKETACIRMAGAFENPVDRPLFHNRARVHHVHSIAKVSHDAEVVGDEKDRCSVLPPNLSHQLQHLRLHGHIERRGRLVGDQQLWLKAQAHGDHGALLHAAGKLMWVFFRPPLRIAEMDSGKKLDRFPFCNVPRRRAMQRQWLPDLNADAQCRIEGAQSVLGNVGHPIAANGSALPLCLVKKDSPPSRMHPDSMRAPRGNIPSAAKAVSVFPLPDSPITPTISPAPIERLTLSTTRASPRGVEKAIDKSRISRVWPARSRGGSAMSVPQMRIKHIAQSVAKEIEAENA